MHLVLGPETRHDSFDDDPADARACSAKPPLAAVIASKKRKDDSVEGSVIFTFHAMFPKRKGSIKSGSSEPEASIVLSYVVSAVSFCTCLSYI